MQSKQNFQHSSSLPSFSPLLDRRITRGRAASEPLNLFALGDEITSKNAKGQTVLFYAIRFGHKCFAKELIEKGCDPNDADAESHYPLHEAVDQSDAAMISLLHEHGARLDVKNMLGQTPLMRAVLFDDVPIMQVLLKAGADPYQKDISGQNIFEYAISTGRENTCLYLLENGYDTLTQDKLHLSHLQMSERSKGVLTSFTSLLTAIKKKKGKIHTKLTEKAQNVALLKINLKFARKNILKKKRAESSRYQDIKLPSFDIINIH